MLDVNAPPGFGGRRGGIARVYAGPGGFERKPWNGGDDFYVAAAMGGEIGEPVLNEHAVRGRGGVRVESCRRDYSHAPSLKSHEPKFRHFTLSIC